MINKPEYLICHHTGGTDADPLADTSHHTFEMVDQYHRSREWESAGYHYFIEKGGKLVKNPYRDDNYHGAHTTGYNQRSLGICLAGNFDVTLPTVSQIESLKKILRMKVDQYKIPLENIVPHRKFASKTCYGKKLSDSWARDILTEEDVNKDCVAELKKKDDLIKVLVEFIKKIIR